MKKVLTAVLIVLSMAARISASVGVPGNFTITHTGSGNLLLRWADSVSNTPVMHYTIFRSTLPNVSDVNYSFVTNTAGSQAFIADAVPNTHQPFYYAVRAEDEAENKSGLSVIKKSYPFPPGWVDIESLNSKAFLRWEAGYDSEITQYNIYRAAAEEGPYTDVSFLSADQYLDTALLNGVVYYYRIA
ncbi:MAG TPA: hypothetical protein ENN43_04860, partial [bacterium]|nr:hypothetical protein [bacterium]